MARALSHSLHARPPHLAVRSREFDLSPGSDSGSAHLELSMPSALLCAAHDAVTARQSSSAALCRDVMACGRAFAPPAPCSVQSADEMNS